MNPEILQTIAQLESLGGQLYMDGEKVKYKPVGNPAIETAIEKLRHYREEVVKVLRERQELPVKRCRACNGYIFWRSVHGAVVCMVCHPPATRGLVREWLWIDEGVKARIQ